MIWQPFPTNFIHGLSTFSHNTKKSMALLMSQTKLFLTKSCSQYCSGSQTVLAQENTTIIIYRVMTSKTGPIVWWNQSSWKCNIYEAGARFGAEELTKKKTWSWSRIFGTSNSPFDRRLFPLVVYGTRIFHFAHYDNHILLYPNCTRQWVFLSHHVVHMVRPHSLK